MIHIRSSKLNQERVNEARGQLVSHVKRSMTQTHPPIRMHPLTCIHTHTHTHKHTHMLREKVRTLLPATGTKSSMGRTLNTAHVFGIRAKRTAL